MNFYLRYYIRCGHSRLEAGVIYRTYNMVPKAPSIHSGSNFLSILAPTSTVRSKVQISGEDSC